MTQCSLGHQLAWHVCWQTCVFIPPPLPDWGRPNAVELWMVKLCREMLWSEIFVWVTAQHGILEGWLAAPQPRIEKPWAQLNECSRRWQKQLSEEALGSHPECWGCEQEHCSGLLPDWYDSVYLQESTKIPDSIAFFFLLAGLVEVHSVYSAARLISCRDAFLHVSTHCWHLLTSV